MYGLDPKKHICQCCLFFSWASHKQCRDPHDLSSWGAQRIWQHCRVVSTTIGMFTMHSTILSFFSLYFSSVREWSNPILLILRQSFIFLCDSPFMLGTIFPAFSPKFCGKNHQFFRVSSVNPAFFPGHSSFRQVSESSSWATRKWCWWVGTMSSRDPPIFRPKRWSPPMPWRCHKDEWGESSAVTDSWGINGD